VELWQLMAREEIRETFTRYSTAADGGRLHDLAAVFAEDGTLDVHGSGSATGRSTGSYRKPQANSNSTIRLRGRGRQRAELPRWSDSNQRGVS